MNLYPLHKELLAEAMSLLVEKYATDDVMRREVDNLVEELTNEGMIEQ